MKTAVAKSGWLQETGVRFDAAYHLSEGRQARHLVESAPLGTVGLGEATKRIFYGGRAKRYYVDSPERGIPFMGSSDMLKADLSSIKYVSTKHTRDLEDSMLQAGWTLISRSGTIGNTAFTTKDFEGKAASEHIIRVVPNGKLPAGYLYAFLSSSFGYGLLTQGTFGAVIQHIEPDFVAEVPVPLLPEAQMQQIHADIEAASTLREQATQLLLDANNLFEEGNGLTYNESWLAPSENIDKAANVVRASDILVTSIKARNHSYRSTQIIREWHRKPGIILNEYLTEPFTNGTGGGYFKRIDDKNFRGPGMVSQSDLHRQNPGNYKRVKIIRATSKDYAQPEMVLFPSVGNAAGENEIFVQPTLAYKLYEGQLLSGDIGRFICNSKEDAAYLFTALRTKAGFRILRAMIYGTTLRRLNWQLIKDINIPIADQNLKNKVSKLVLRAFDFRHEANQLENKAIQAVETAISSWQK
ncbi:restriction endonuclease subunit S [Hymenobacter gummosus]|uniref:Restriction endonuclease subunit S n=1 Tax=Hymenobacter gummosus TaxID=1776032 RepID=A0A431TVR5_9BACT|nr:restriction endonuclease subunit S [Hymenobacter gummosus]RTQ45463.1 restriction endonuclease subunit S [Hymenobacter gummosus]